MNATRARGMTLRPAPAVKNGQLIREPAVCDRCLDNCTVGGNIKVAHGFYTFNGGKLCKTCIRRVGVL